ncbi:MAG: hypothetical protein ACOCXP_00525 [Candidatus Dojkabacteria bacterium]
MIEPEHRSQTGIPSYRKAFEQSIFAQKHKGYILDTGAELELYLEQILDFDADVVELMDLSLVIGEHPSGIRYCSETRSLIYEPEGNRLVTYVFNEKWNVDTVIYDYPVGLEEEGNFYQNVRLVFSKINEHESILATEIVTSIVHNLYSDDEGDAEEYIHTETWTSRTIEAGRFVWRGEIKQFQKHEYLDYSLGANPEHRLMRLIPYQDNTFLNIESIEDVFGIREYNAMLDLGKKRVKAVCRRQDNPNFYDLHIHLNGRTYHAMVNLEQALFIYENFEILTLNDAGLLILIDPEEANERGEMGEMHETDHLDYYDYLVGPADIAPIEDNRRIWLKREIASNSMN